MCTLRITSFEEVTGIDRKGQTFTKFVIGAKAVPNSRTSFVLEEILDKQTLKSDDLAYEIWIDSRQEQAKVSFSVEFETFGNCFIALPLFCDAAKMRQILEANSSINIDINGCDENRIRYVSSKNEIMGSAELKETVRTGDIGHIRTCSFSFTSPSVKLSEAFPFHKVAA